MRFHNAWAHCQMYEQLIRRARLADPGDPNVRQMERMCYELYTELLQVYPPILNVPEFITPVEVYRPPPTLKPRRIHTKDRLNYLLLSFYVTHQYRTPEILWRLIDYRMDTPSSHTSVAESVM